MEAPVAGILVLRLAVSAHGEGGHGGGSAVIGYVADDGVARTAMGAIGEWISVAAVERVAKVAPAGVARARVRRDEHEFAGFLPAGKDRKACASLGLHIRDSDL